MTRLFGVLLALCCCLPPTAVLADDASHQIVGTWKVVSLVTKFEGGDTVEFFGSNPKGRLVLTPDHYLTIILTRANRSQAKSPDEKAALLDSMLAYSGKYTIEGDRITTHVDMSWNEIYTGPLQNQTRFFSLDGDKLIIRTGQIPSALRPGQKAEGILTLERER